MHPRVGRPEPGDPLDVSRWYLYNPSLGFQLLEPALMKDARTMNADTFAREHLGWWPQTLASSRPIEATAWAECRVDDPSREGIVVYAVKFTPDGSVGTMAACHKPEDGRPFVYVVDSRSLSHGIGWFVDTLSRVGAKAAQIVIDGQGNAQALNDRLLEAGVPSRAIIRPGARDVATACAAISNAVKERAITHYGQPALDASATLSRKRRIGDALSGGWGFASTDEADATLIEACALAYWSAMRTKRDPERRAEVWDW